MSDRSPVGSLDPQLLEQTLPEPSEDLKRRYVGIDYVAEFQRHWSYFNRWFNAEFDKNTDRDRVEELKLDARIVTGVEKAAALGHSQRVLRRMSQPGTEIGDLDRYRFYTPTLISTFTSACFGSTAVQAKLNVFDGNPGPIRSTSTIAVSDDEFEDVYRMVMSLQDEFVAESPVMGVTEAMEHRCIRFDGSAFTVNASATRPTGRSAYGDACWTKIQSSDNLIRLRKLSESPGQGLTHDIVEMLYCVRNAAVHGELDFVDPADNEAARQALAVLDTLVQAI